MPTLRSGLLSFHYLADGEGPPVLMLHGHGSCAQDWELQVEALRGAYRVIRLDQRGHGQSDKPEGPYTARMLAADATEVLRQVVGGPAHVIGHSMGGGVALQLALDAPDLVRSLVIINSQASFRPRTLFERIAFPVIQVIPRIIGFGLHGKAIAAGYLSGPRLAERRAIFLERWKKNDPVGYFAAQSGIYEFDVSGRLGEIAQPTLVVASDRDILPLAHKRELVDKMKDARLIMIEDSRHVPLWDQPEALNQALCDFLRDRATSKS